MHRRARVDSVFDAAAELGGVDPLRQEVGGHVLVGDLDESHKSWAEKQVVRDAELGSFL